MLEHCIKDQSVLVTGAGGSIGSELCRQILSLQPTTLLLFEHSEFNLYCILSELEQRIARMDQYLLQGLQPWQPQLRLLQTLPGIDEQGAAMLLVEIGADMSVFGSAERLASWVGICPGNNESAGKRKTGRIRKGNAWVRRLLCEFAQAAARTRCALKAKFDALTIRKGHKKSVVALAHKMLRTINAMIRNGRHYPEMVVFYEALNVQRNAPRWIKMLRKHGFIATPAAA